MKTIPFTLILLHLLFNQTTYSQWVKTNGPGVDRIFSIASNGASIFAGSFGGGVFISSDDGMHWSCPNIGLNDFDVYSIYVNQGDDTKTKIYVVTKEGSVFFSEDTAQTWHDISSNLDRTRSAYSIVAIDTTLFVGTEAQGIFRSADNGLHWSQIMPERYVYDLKVKKNVGVVSEIFACTDVGIYRSRNLGSSWFQISPGFHPRSLAIQDSNFYAGAEYGVYLSSDNGASWNLAKTGIPGDVSFPSVCAIKGQSGATTLFAGSYGKGIFISHDNGNTWNESNLGFDYPFVLSTTARINAQGGITVYAGTEAGMYISCDGGSSWKFAGCQLTSTTPYALHLSNRKLFAATERNVFISTDKGDYWSACKFDAFSVGDVPIVKSLCNTVNKNGDTVYFAGTDNLGIFISTDHGYNWTKTGIGLSKIISMTSIPNVNPSGSERIFVGTASGLFYTSSDTIGAVRCNPSYPTNTLISINNPSGGYELFAGTDNKGIYRSTDNGFSWYPRNTGMLSLSVSCLASILASNGGNIIFAGAKSASLFYSVDHGAQWEKIQDPSLRTTPTAIRPFRSKDGILHLAVGTNKGFLIYQQSDTGWVKVSSELPESYFYSIEVIDSTLFAGIYHNGVWAKTYSKNTTSIPFNKYRSPKISLNQNYPNPFNSSTIISYDLPLTGNVKLELYDLVGRKILVLIDENQIAGTHAVNFDASALPSGIYFYRLNSRGFVVANKLVLVK